MLLVVLLESTPVYHHRICMWLFFRASSITLIIEVVVKKWTS